MALESADLLIKVSLKDFLFSKPENIDLKIWKNVNEDSYVFSCSLLSSSNFILHSLPESSEAGAGSVWPFTISEPSAAGLSRALATWNEDTLQFHF